MCLVRKLLLETIHEYHEDMKSSLSESDRRTNKYHLQQSCIAFTLLELSEGIQGQDEALTGSLS